MNLLLTFHLPNFMSLFRCLGRTKVLVQVRGKCSWFATKTVFTVRSCQHLAQHPIWRTIPCWLSAIAYSIYSQLPSYWRSFHHPQPEDAPCRGDKDPFVTSCSLHEHDMTNWRRDGRIARIKLEGTGKGKILYSGGSCKTSDSAMQIIVTIHRQRVTYFLKLWFVYQY